MIRRLLIVVGIGPTQDVMLRTLLRGTALFGVIALLAGCEELTPPPAKEPTISYNYVGSYSADSGTGEVNLKVARDRFTLVSFNRPPNPSRSMRAASAVSESVWVVLHGTVSPPTNKVVLRATQEEHDGVMVEGFTSCDSVASKSEGFDANHVLDQFEDCLGRDLPTNAFRHTPQSTVVGTWFVTVSGMPETDRAIDEELMWKIKEGGLVKFTHFRNFDNYAPLLYLEMGIRFTDTSLRFFPVTSGYYENSEGDKISLTEDEIDFYNEQVEDINEEYPVIYYTVSREHMTWRWSTASDRTRGYMRMRRAAE